MVNINGFKTFAIIEISSHPLDKKIYSLLDKNYVITIF
jgi:hypothetical protein